MKKQNTKPTTKALGLRVPESIMERLRKVAGEDGSTLQAVVFRILCESFGIDYVPPKVGKPRKETEK